MKTLLNKTKTGKKKKKNIDEIKELEKDRRKYENNFNKLQPQLKELNKIHVGIKNLHEMEQEILMDYTGEYEMVGNLKVGDQIRQNHIRFGNNTEYEAYVISFDEGHDAEDALFNGYINKIDTSQFNLVNRSQYGNGYDFKHEIIEY